MSESQVVPHDLLEMFSMNHLWWLQRMNQAYLAQHKLPPEDTLEGAWIAIRLGVPCTCVVPGIPNIPFDSRMKCPRCRELGYPFNDPLAPKVAELRLNGVERSGVHEGVFYPFDRRGFLEALEELPD